MTMAAAATTLTRHIPLTHLSLKDTWHKTNCKIMKSMRRSTSTTQDLHLSMSSLSLSSSSSSTSSSDSEEDAVIQNVVANIQQVKRKAIQFGRVNIIEFPYTLGDNPSVSSGPPISMGPIHQDRFSVDLLEYDDAKLSIHRRSIPEMRMDQMLRTHILQSSGHTLREIMQATIEAQDHRELRRQSVQSSSTHLMLYRAKTNARRRLQSSFVSLKQRNFATSMQQRVSQTNNSSAGRNTTNTNSKTNQPKNLGATTHMRPRDSLTL